MTRYRNIGENTESSVCTKANYPLFCRRRELICVKRQNYLSENLRAYQKMKGCTQAEFSAELGVPTSTLQTVLYSGNTTLDTLLHLAEALDVSLDELVCCRQNPQGYAWFRQMMQGFGWYVEMDEERQNAVWYHVCQLIQLVKTNEE